MYTSLSDFDYGYYPGPMDSDCYLFSNPYRMPDLISDLPSPDIPDMPLQCELPFRVDPYTPLASDVPMPMFNTPTVDVQGPQYMFSNPFGTFPDWFMDMMMPGLPSHSHSGSIIDSEPVEERPIIGPSKSDWERFDSYEAERAQAVENYKECLENGDLRGADRYAEEARKAQYGKEVIYDVGYVTDIDQRAGLI